MSSTEYTDMANTISNNNTRCEHDVVLCDACLIAAAEVLNTTERNHVIDMANVTDERNADLNRMRDIHYSETQALRDEVSAYRNTLDETRQSAVDAAERMQIEHNRVVANVTAEIENKLFLLRSDHDNAMRALRNEHEMWKNNLAIDAHEYANENNLCGVFDAFMIEHGLPARTREYEVEVDVEFRVRITREGSSAEDAAESIDQDDVDEAIVEFVREHNATWTTGYVTPVRD